ncbi:gluconate 2-dehydrogenase subunit 3 family protein [Candidatus Venteria ishoeyi]|uniref:gluconate 2-dehydrogenase subunit 3 family protein n=1 Tax=Candidatus Venteria ishoeyi TaxID=1899563 RepID=UPI0025A542AE|nr:gluconate 2-dehydrogenase subunit 3 family protein [Candidatus Venteria ishoeyi]MDM8547033.1 gluconate 2-dehydrogenase subunit 3 family protein [Candidatus Venteria ishoeyi]
MLKKSFNRRLFLQGSGGLAVAGLLPTVPLNAAPNHFSDVAGLSAGQWQTLAAVQEHLFPAQPDTPGADDLNALVYLQNVLSQPEQTPEDRNFIRDGVLQVADISRQQQQKAFTELNESQREQVLRHMEQDKTGAQWLRTVLNYLMEALLTDPVYGGNPRGIGWAWVGHEHGFPRPPTDKRYFLL